MTIDWLTHFQVRPLELAVWTAVMLCVGTLALWNHGRPEHSGEVHWRAIEESAQNAQTVNASSGVGGRIDLNAATETELSMLPGIGHGRARAIIKERTRRGAFGSIWELSEVKGLTRALIQRIEPLIQVSLRTNLPPRPPGNPTKQSRPATPGDSPRP